MADQLIPRRELEFQLYEVLNVTALCHRERFSDHTKETFNATLDTAEQIAEDLFLPHNAKADQNEPLFDGQNVTMIPEVKAAYDAYCQAGFVAGRYDYEEGGMQLPDTIMKACSGYFLAANPASVAYPFLTSAAAKVIKHFASEQLKAAFLEPMLSGKFTGTMALTEPHAGSSLTDIHTKAMWQEDGSYRIKGSKIYISGGEHELSDNIVHLVLAKIPGGPGGVKGISLFIVPKYRVDETGNFTQKNDIALAGLIHKLGYRGTTSTALVFGDNNDCHGYLVGKPHQGLKYMFMMMNEARVGVGFGATMIGYRGYRYSLAYAKERTQGRVAPNLDATDPPCAIIEHGDIKRMLLAQKSYTEGAMALGFYGTLLVDDSQTGETEAFREDASLLLDLITPICKAWPSEFGVKANDLAIQVLGGAGYTREYPVEQCWRDNRLNPIHEGTNGIQALDLLGRKLWLQQGRGLSILTSRILHDVAQAATPQCAGMASDITRYLEKTTTVVNQLKDQLQTSDAQTQLTNANCFLAILGHVIVSWMWLRQAIVAERALLSANVQHNDYNFYQGKLAAAAYFVRWELPTINHHIHLLQTTDSTCASMQSAYF